MPLCSGDYAFLFVIRLSTVKRLASCANDCFVEFSEVTECFGIVVGFTPPLEVETRHKAVAFQLPRQNQVKEMRLCNWSQL